MGDQVGGNLGRVTEHQAHHAGRHAGIDEALEQGGRRGRGFLGRLAQEGAARGQRRADLAHDLVDGEVPGREGSHGAHGLLDHQLLHFGPARRNDAAIHAQRLVGKPFDDAHAGQDFALGLGHGLALLLRQQGRDLVGTLLEQGSGTAHGSAALMGRDIAPDLEAALRGGQRAIQVGHVGMGHLADDFAAGRVAHGNLPAAGGVLPLAVDQELGIGVGVAHAGSGPW
jgi:hypothetical protein